MKVGLILIIISTLNLYSQIISDYEKDFAYGTPEIKIKTIETISKKGDIRATELLFQNLDDPNWRVRVAIVKALHQLGAKQYTLKLIDKLTDSSPEVCSALRALLIDFADITYLRKQLIENPLPQIRQQIAILLGEAKDTASVDVLIEALKDTDFVRYSAVKSLGQIKDKKATEAVIKMLKDPTGEIRLEAARTLSELEVYESIPLVLELLLDTDESVKTGIEIVIEKFICEKSVLYFTEALKKDKRPQIRKYAVKALGILGDSSVIPLLIQAQTDKDLSVRQEATESLRKLVDRTSTFQLCLLLDSPDIAIRTAAVKTIEEINDARAFPSLIDRLKKESSPELKELIQKTIIAIADESILYFIKKALTDRNMLVRIVAIKTVEKLQTKAFLPALTEALKTEKEIEIKYNLIAAIRSFADKSVLKGLHEVLLTDKTIEVKLAVLSVLKEKAFLDYSSIPVALQCLKFGNESINLEAEDLLDQLSNTNSVGYFFESVKDSNLFVRACAIRAIKKFPVKEALPYALIALTDKDPYIRRDAVYVLGQIGDKSVIEKLSKLLNDSFVETRVEAVKSLGQIGGEEIVKYIEKSLKDKSSEVRLAAVKVLSDYIHHDVKVVTSMIKMLKRETDVSVKEETLLTLRKVDIPEVHSVLIYMLKDPDPTIRRVAVFSLGELNNPKFIPVLAEVFRKDLYTEVQIEAMQALTKLNAKEMIPDFIDKLTDPSREVSEMAKKSLDMLITNADVSFLVASLQREEKTIKTYCIHILTKLKPKEALPELFQFVRTKTAIRTQVMKLIDSMADKKNLVDFLTVVDNPSVNTDIELQLWVIKNLGKFGDEKTVEYIAKTLQHESTEIRKESISALTQLGGKKALEMLKYVAENDTSISVRNLAKKALTEK